jgi:hypothetical protein
MSSTTRHIIYAVLDPACAAWQSRPRIHSGYKTSSLRAMSSMRFLKHNVVPGRRKAASPEPITTNLSDQIATQDHGLRAPAFGRLRNDALRIGARDVMYGK